MNSPATSHDQRTILLIDDEQSVRSIVMKILQRASFKVVEAESGEAALKIVESHTGTIDLVVTDLHMPGLNGPEVVKKLATLRPGLKVLFMSGYAEHDIVARTGVPGGANFLHKPFSGQELTNAVKAAIG
jgi:two-component system, cell cycle sensor histidine kinase and response regulator CckA